MSFAFFLQAQTGPGQIGTTNVTHWVKADAGVTTSGSDVTAWNSNIGTTHYVNGTNKPVLVANAQNGLPVIRFDGAAQQSLQNTSTSYQARSVFVVFKPTAYTAANSFGQVWGYYNGGVHLAIDDRSSNQTWSVDGNSSNQGQVSVNGSSLGTSNGNPTSPKWTYGFQVAHVELSANRTLTKQFISDIETSTTLRYNGDVAEILVYDRVLTAVEKVRVNNYLGRKWGITVDVASLVTSEYTNSYNKNLVLIGNASASQRFDTTAGNGAGIYLKSAIAFASNERIWAGNNGLANGLNNTDVVGSSRNNNVWYISKVNPATSGNIEVSFGTQDLGFGANNQGGRVPSDYKLLYRSGTSGNFAEITAAKTFTNSNKVTFTVSAASLASGYYTLGLPSGNKWYSYLPSGTWNDPDTWTLDASGSLYINPSAALPTANDEVIILNGKKVTVATNTKSTLSLKVDKGGILDLGTTTGHTFQTIKGDGEIRLSSPTFPSYTTISDFASQGKVKFYGSGYTLSTSYTFFDVDVDLTNSTDNIILASNLTANGSLTIKKGNLQVGNSSTARNLTIGKNFYVQSTGSFKVDQAYAGSVVTHVFDLKGNFTNEGVCKFSNVSTYDYAGTNVKVKVDARFTNSLANQAVYLDGLTEFYRIVSDKGVDASYELSFVATSTSNFKLYGKNNQSGPGDGITENPHALGLKSGTVRLGANIVIPEICSGSNNYDIPEATTLWIENSNVAMSGGTALVIYGSMKVTGSSAVVNITSSSGITLREVGVLDVQDGVVNLNQLRTSTLGAGVTHFGAYKQSGGYVTIRNSAGGAAGGFYLFDLARLDNTFIMSGGTLHVKRANDVSGAIFINCKSTNHSVTGGDVIVEILATATQSSKISSTVPFYNLTLRNSTANTAREFSITGGSSGSPSISMANQKLKVLGNLVLESSAVLNHNGNDVIVYGNFTLNTGSIYKYNAGTPNTTFLKGTGNKTIDFQNLTASAYQEFWNLDIQYENDSDTLLLLANSGKTKTARNNDLFLVNGNFYLRKGALDQSYYSIGLKCDTVYNAGDFGYRVGSGANNDNNANSNNDRIRFYNNGTKTLVYDYSGTWGIVELASEANIIQLETDLTGLDRFYFRSGRLYAQNHAFAIGAILQEFDPAQANFGGCGGCYSKEDMIVLSGNASDDGLGLSWGKTTGSITYPVGVGLYETDPNARYTPIRVKVKTAGSANKTNYISIGDTKLPTTDPTGGNILSYYWKLQSGFTSGTLPKLDSIILSYSSYDDDNSAIATFVPGKVLETLPFTRSVVGTNANINTTTKTITFKYSGSGLDVESASYTAGQSARFIGSPTIFYSNGTGGNGNQTPLSWKNKNSWSNVGHYTTAPKATTAPTLGSIVYIAFDPTIDLTTAATHVVSLDTSVNVGQVIFATTVKDASNVDYNKTRGPLPELIIRNTIDTASLGYVSGRGEIVLEVNCTFCDPNPNFSLADIPFISGDFYDFSENGANWNTWEYNLIMPDNSTVYIPSNYPSNYPRLDIDANDGTNRAIVFQNDVTVRSRMRMFNRANLIMHNGTSGDLTITNGLRMDQSAYADNESIKFQSTGNSRTISISGPIVFESPQDKIFVDSTSANGLVHKFIYRGDIGVNDTLNLKDGYLDFYASGANGTKVDFQIENQDYSSFTSNELTISDFSTINVANSDTAIFEFKDNFKLSGATNTATKPLTLSKGKLILNDSDINIDLTTGGGDFIIPSTAHLEVKLGKVNVKNSSNLKLGGILSVTGGTVDLSSDGNKNNLTYSSTGLSQLNFTSGNLLVGGQFMRHLDDDQATIKYIQSGGTGRFGINGFNTSQRGVFEVIGALSQFNYSGGTFGVESGNMSTVIGALHLYSIGTYSVGSNSIILLGGGANLNQTIGVNSTHEIPVLTLSNLGDNPIASVIVNPLKVRTINIGTGSKLMSNNIDVYVSKLFNNLQGLAGYEAGTNTTYFTGTGTRITGTTVFNNINSNIPNTTGLQLSANSDIYCNDFFLNGNFNISSSVNATGDFTAGSFAQSFVKSPTVATSYFKFVGTLKTQIISANQNKPNFDRLYIENTEGVNLKRISGQPVFMSVNKDLKIENGVFDIFDDRLILRNGATVTSSSSFSKSKMIRTTGALSQSGVALGGLSDVLYSNHVLPIGVGNSYLPVVVTYKSSNSTQFVIVKPVNQQHQTTLPFSGNLLKTYWNISYLNTASFDTIGFSFGYNQSDVYGDENIYGSAYLPKNNDWILKVPTDQDGPISADVDTSSNTVKFGYKTYSPISTDFTCGDTKTPIPLNAFPINIPLFITANSGLWSDGSTWVGGVVPSVGSKVQINSTHNVTLAVNTINTYSVLLDGQLDVGATIKHNFGTINGNGVLKVSGGLIPGGSYSSFLTDTGGVVNFSGTGTYTVDSRVTAARGLVFSGTGVRELPNVAVSIGDSLVVDGVTVDNTVNNVSLQVQGDVSLKNGGVFKFGTGGLSFTSSKISYVKSSLVGLSQLSSLTLNKSDTGKVILLGDSVFVKNTIDFRKGVFEANDKKVLLGTNISFVTSPWDSSYIEGTSCKDMIATTSFNFPTGDNFKYALSGIHEVTAGTWCARYVRKNPTADGYSVTAIKTESPQIKVVNDNDYWIVTGPTSAVAAKGVSFVWNNPEPLVNTSDLVVAEWDAVNNYWYSKGQTFYNSGSKKLKSAGGVTFSTKVFTFATTAIALPVEFGKVSTELVSNSNVRISWETYTEKNNNFFAVERSTDGVNFIEIGQVLGQGNSETKVEYNFLDQSLETGVYYYRIKQVDFDGKYDYSAIVVQNVKLDKSDTDFGFDFTIVPNPVYSGSVVSFVFDNSNNNPLLSIIDAVGNVVEISSVEKIDNKINYRANINPGIYLVRIQYLNKIVTKRLVVQ